MLALSVALLILIAFLRANIGANAPPAPAISYNFSTWAAHGWNAQSAAAWIQVQPHESTFLETLGALPLLLGWWVRGHQNWGLASLFFATVMICGLWRIAAHLLGSRQPSVLLPALVVLQCAALGWGWTFFAPMPYHPETKLAVLDLKSTSSTLLSARQQIAWHQQNGYTGFAFGETADKRIDWTTSYPGLFFIPPSIAQGYAAQLTPNAQWWVFPQGTSSIKQLQNYWKKGEAAAVSLQEPPVHNWSMLPSASRWNVLLSLIALGALIVLWGLQPAASAISAPGRITDFLQKRRRPKRAAGLLIMLATVAGILLSLWLTFYPAWGFVRQITLPLSITAILWVILDFYYWRGRKSWKKMH